MVESLPLELGYPEIHRQLPEGLKMIPQEMLVNVVPYLAVVKKGSNPNFYGSCHPTTWGESVAGIQRENPMLSSGSPIFCLELLVAVDKGGLSV